MIYTGDALEVLKTMPEQSVYCIVTSPPYYGLRDYGTDAQIGLEAEPELYINRLVAVFREARRVLRDDGTMWLNLGDSYNSGSGPGGPGRQWRNRGGALFTRPRPKPRTMAKNLMGIPWRVAFALQADGWNLRQDIIWYKPNVMPESVKDRCTKAHEYIFLMTKTRRYYFDAEAIAEKCITKSETGRRNKRSVWSVSNTPFKGAHFATFPTELIRPCIKAGCPVGCVVLDPFFGSGTTGVVAIEEGRRYIGIELNPEYVDLARQRLAAVERTGAALF